MHRYTLYPLILLMLMAATPFSARASEADRTTLTQLPNGLTVLVQQDDRFPLAALRLYVHAGSAYETDEQAGLSHLLEHMVFKGTDKRAPGQVAKDIESVGGYVNAATSFDYTSYTIDVPAEKWALGMDVLQDMIFGSKFDPDELSQERKVVLAELERGEDAPGSILFKTMQNLVWSPTTYRRPIIGYRDTVSGFTSDDLKGYIAQYYQPQSMLLVVVGDVDNDEVLAEAQRLFGGLHNDRVVQPVQPARGSDAILGLTNGPVVSVRQGAWNKVYLSAALPLPGAHSPDTPALDVLGQLLGGDNTSRLYRRFKYQEQLVDDISAMSMSLERQGILYISATLDPANLQTFWKELLEELGGLSAVSFTDQELDRAILNLEDGIFRAKETLSGLASKLAMFQFFDGGLAAEDKYIHDLRHVDRDQLNAVIARYLRPDRLACAVLLPEGAHVAEASANKSADTADDPAKALGAAMQAEAARTWSLPQAADADAVTGEAENGTERIDLGQGRSLVLIPDDTLPYTSVDLAYRGGDVLLDKGQDGLAVLAARTLTKGAGDLDATALQDFLSDRAAGLSATANRTLFTVQARFPSRFSDDVLGLLQDVILRPALAPDELEREKQGQIALIHSREDKPLPMAFRRLFPFLYDTAPYSMLHRGEPEGIATYTVDDIAGFWAKQRTMPWTMAVCGDFDREAVVEAARALASATGTVAAPPYAAPAFSERMREELTLPGRNQTHILALWPVPAMAHEDTPGLELLQAALSGQGGLLFRDLRDQQGLGYTVTAFLWQNPATGFLALYIGTYPDKAEQALEGFHTAIERLKAEPLPQAELDRAKQLLMGNYYRDHQSLGSRSNEAALLAAEELPASHYRDVIDKAQKLTPQDIQKLVSKYLTGEPRLLTVAP